MAAPILELIRKDILVFRSDRRSMIVSFVAPILLGSIMVWLMGNEGLTESTNVASNGQNRLPILVIDHDHSLISREVRARLLQDPNVEVLADPIERAAAFELVRRGGAEVLIEFSKDFGNQMIQSLVEGREPSLVLLTHDPNHPIQVAMVRALLTQQVIRAFLHTMLMPESNVLKDVLKRIEQSSSRTPSQKLAFRTLLSASVAWLRNQDASPNGQVLSGDGSSRFRLPFEVRMEAAMPEGNAGARAARNAHAFVGMMIQFILFASIEAGVGLLTEREKGLWRRIRSAPISRFTLLLSRGLSGHLISFAIATVVMGSGMLLHDFRVRGSVAGLILVAFCYSAMASAFGLLIATIGKTPQAARGISVLAVLLMVMLGGAWVPTFLFPPWLQSLSSALPTRWAIDGLDATLIRGATLTRVLPNAMLLLCYTAMFAGLAVLRFRWEAD